MKSKIIINQNPFIKLVIIGDSGVGKSSLLKRVCEDQFSENYLAMIGVDFKLKPLSVDGKQVKLQIWDITRSQKYRAITAAYYRGADGIILVFDVSNEDSFNSIQFWMNEIKNQAPTDAYVMLIGNKSDIENKQFSTETAQQYAESKQMEFFEVSAKTSDSVMQAFLSLTRKIKNKKEAKDPVRLAEQIFNSNQQRSQNQILTSNNLAKKKDKNGCV